MRSTKLSEISAAEATPDESRREALRKFGRYAAVAPTAMVLLEPRHGQAKPRRGKGWGRGGNPRKKGRGSGGGY